MAYTCCRLSPLLVRWYKGLICCPWTSRRKRRLANRDTLEAARMAGGSWMSGLKSAKPRNRGGFFFLRPADGLAAGRHAEYRTGRVLWGRFTKWNAVQGRPFHTPATAK